MLLRYPEAMTLKKLGQQFARNSVNLSMARNHTPGKLMSARPYYWSWTVVIASTGAGKSMPFIMPLLVDETCHKVVIIISGAFRVHLDHFFN